MESLETLCSSKFLTFLKLMNRSSKVMVIDEEEQNRLVKECLLEFYKNENFDEDLDEEAANLSYKGCREGSKDSKLALGTSRINEAEKAVSWGSKIVFTS